MAEVERLLGMDNIERLLGMDNIERLLGMDNIDGINSCIGLGRSRRRLGYAI
jgi:hypothetical protein